MKYAYTILYVDNVLETIEFYKKAFGFAEKFCTPEKDYGELVSGETTIAFASIALGNSNLKNGFTKSTQTQKPFGIELAFTTDTIDTDFQNAIQYGAILVAPISQKPWGQRVGYIRDINGFLIELCTPIATS